MSKLLTPTRYDKLYATPEGKRVLDAAVAVAMGWELKLTGHRCSDGAAVFRWVRGDRQFKADCPPPYASVAADAPDYGRLMMEMILALPVPVCVWHFTSGQWGVDMGKHHADCDTLSLALIKALAAAGMLKEPEE
jgi:hypothetical protein